MIGICCCNGHSAKLPHLGGGALPLKSCLLSTRWYRGAKILHLLLSRIPRLSRYLWHGFLDIPYSLQAQFLNWQSFRIKNTFFKVVGVTAPAVRTVWQRRLTSRIAEHNSIVFDMVSVSCTRLALEVFVFWVYSIINESPCLLSNPFSW